ncbi:hypothetical protein DKT77_13465 [Meridianimarinicoccus roseus]|uniref:Nitrile hydratase beta subunit-like N-terminal domain-containing protein n=1 Tax=Meridianimarinicoccus roseus TaxID=2072018 RepID=A0A2V2L9G3_9RHOB|nr:SH3-like domain-containing protein [Meridianimarinicoccus roseus]PWR02088.1 hypothetical protein DKT77_13465 [Meridianimarinicoccus roseus]
MTDRPAQKRYHDIGGADFGAVTRDETPMSQWQWESEAIRALMGSERHPYLTLDKLRRTYEEFGEELYERGFHQRRTASMVHLLIEQGVITRSELNAALKAQDGQAQ